MSLDSLREVRLMGKRPWVVRLIVGDCPHPEWPWFAGDPSLVWAPESRNIAAYDLRPLVGLPVVVLTHDMSRFDRAAESALDNCKALFAGIAQHDKARATDKHPWAKRLQELAGDRWQGLIEPVLMSDWDVYLGGGHGIAL